MVFMLLLLVLKLRNIITNMKHKQAKWYYCKFCGTKWQSLYLAELCFETDLKNLENENKLKNKKK